MADISNYENYMLVSGTNDADSIYSSGSNTTIQAFGGNDSIDNGNYPSDAGINVTIDGGDGDDEINNNGENGSISGGSGNDDIGNYGANTTILGDTGNDQISNGNSNVTINAGDGDDTIHNDNAHAGNVIISGGDGNDRVTNIGSNVSLNGDSGDDRISTGLREGLVGIGYELEDRNNFATNVTINGGAGNDTISLASAATGNVIQYALGDGNDTVYGFHSAATLIISGSAHTSAASGNDIIITVDDGGTITLKDVGTSGDLSSNIVLNGETTPQTETVTDTSTTEQTTTNETLPPVLGNAVYDIVFIIDSSGSMSTYIDRVNAIAEKFADILNARQIYDYRLAVVDYEAEPFVYNLATDGSGGIFTTSTDGNAIQAFKDAMSAASSKTAANYGTENGLYAINHALDNFPFREGANLEFIVLTDEDYDDTNFNVTTTKQKLKDSSVQLDVIGEKGYSCESEWTPVAQFTGGNFYDINGDYNDTFNNIVGNLDKINVDLSTVPDGQTGYFLINPNDPELKDKNSTVAVFFPTTTPDIETYLQAYKQIGAVTADKVYSGANNDYRQNISIPDGWSVTATSKNDVLNVTGTGAGVVIASGEGHDAVNLGESATGIILTDHNLTDDMLSFAKRQTPSTFTENAETNPETNLNQVTLTAPTMTVVLQNFKNSNEELLKYNVTNENLSNTVDELLHGESEDKRGTYQIHFNSWHYSFTPPEDSPLYSFATSADLAENLGSPSLEEISSANFAVTADNFSERNLSDIFSSSDFSLIHAVLAKQD